MSNKLTHNALIVGLGNIGSRYDLNADESNIIRTHARALTKHVAFKLVAGVDLDMTYCTEFENTYQIQTYNKLETALAHHNPDLVVVSTPTDSHLKVIETVVKLTKPKAILCEKPLAYSVGEAERIVLLCKQNNIKLFVNFIRRADPAVLKIKHYFETDVIVKPVKGFAWYTKGFLHNGSHLFDLLSLWLGNMVSSQVITIKKINSGLDFVGDVNVEFSRGSILFAAMPENSFSMHAIELFSASGRLRYDYNGHVVTWYPAVKKTSQKTNIELDRIGKTIESNLRQYQWNVLDHINFALQGCAHNLCTGETALANQKKMHSIFFQANG